MLLDSRQTFRHRACAHLGDDAVEVDEAHRDADESSHLADPVALSLDEAKARNGILPEFDPHRRAADILDRAEIGRVVAGHAVTCSGRQGASPSRNSPKRLKSPATKAQGLGLSSGSAPGAGAASDS